MWYAYLNREQCYLRSYRSHNLWLDHYHLKMRTPRVIPWHIGMFKRLGKTYSGVSTLGSRTASPIEIRPFLTFYFRLALLACSMA